ncbi:chemotaxis protein methyltransferase [Litchfieldella qijiaojingensis]|uniref:Chemotaxis protein methyltransferase n=1 Tax=Litchfieldella qijiaojingensis TaxID=980347 RepID=A0ABQ2Z904_9GAMM|nr:protein-glutamate O-methyltransferase [Halomonas qijiaojingensis]GGY08859.1 chemotaxis protein methyltransferase [Halomonas qijiaojingensis]
MPSPSGENPWSIPENDRLSERDFGRIAELIGEHAGIKLPPTKRLMVEGRLRKRVRGLGHQSLADYCRFLFDGHGLTSELVHVIDAVTTNKTDFFREPTHFVALEEKIVPALLERHASPEPRIKLWSAACSNGAEVYTIAMVMAEIAARHRHLRFSVLGTDISTEMLEYAAQAIYPVAMVEPVPTALRNRYLMQGRAPSRRSEVRIVPELRNTACFARLNLMDTRYTIDRDVDVIFLRNVLIYFEKATQEAVVSRLVGHLRPGGFLILGHSESMIGSNLNLRQVAPAVFQKS